MKARFEEQKELAKKAFKAVKEDPVNPKHVLAVAALILLPALVVTYNALTYEDKVITSSPSAKVLTALEEKPSFDTTSFEGRVLAAAQNELKTIAKLSDTKAQATKTLLSLEDSPDNRVTFMINSMNSVVFDVLANGLKFEKCVELSKSENTFNCFVGFNPGVERQSKEAFLAYDYPDYIYGVAFTFKDGEPQGQLLDFQVGYTSNPDFKAQVNVNPPTNLDGTLITSGSGDSNELPAVADGEFLPGTDAQTLLDSYKPKEDQELQQTQSGNETSIDSFAPVLEFKEPNLKEEENKMTEPNTEGSYLAPEMPLGRNSPGFMKPAQSGPTFSNSLNPMAPRNTTKREVVVDDKEPATESEDREILYTRPLTLP